MPQDGDRHSSSILSNLWESSNGTPCMTVNMITTYSFYQLHVQGHLVQ